MSCFIPERACSTCSRWAFIFTTVAQPARVMLSYGMLLQFLGGIQSLGAGGGGVAFWAHAGKL
jgi:hypothetical protein